MKAQALKDVPVLSPEEQAIFDEKKEQEALALAAEKRERAQKIRAR